MISGSVFCSSSQYFHIGVFSCVMQETKAMVEKLAIIVFLVLHPEEKCSGYETSGADPVILFILSIFFICGIFWVIVTLKKKTMAQLFSLGIMIFFLDLSIKKRTSAEGYWKYVSAGQWYKTQ